MAIYTRDNLPLGAILPMASSLAWSLPSAGQVKNGLALCDGQPFSSLPSGKYHPSFSGNRPNLSDSRFLIGDTSPGTHSVAQNSYKLATGNIPTITTGNQSADHTHTYSGNVDWMSVDHSHYFSGGIGGQDTDHGHGIGTGTVNTGHLHTYVDYWYQETPDANLSGEGDDNGANAYVRRTSGSDTDASGGHTHGIGTGGRSAAHAHYFEGWSGYVSSDHNHTYSGSSQAGNADHTHTFGNATPSDVDNRPLFFSVVYVMKVK